MNIWGHFKVVTEHRFIVMKYCFKAGMIWQGLTHDLSKYSWVEFSEGCKYWQGNRSPNTRSKEVNGVSYAWLHHKGRNKHHYEYWIDYDLKSERFLGGMRMPRKYVAEMVFDRISACRVYLGKNYTQSSAYEYYYRTKDRLWFVEEETRRDLEKLLLMTAEHGEQYTIDYIRNIYLKVK